MFKKKKVFIINLKYFRDSENNYIIFRNVTDKPVDNCVISRKALFKDLLLKKEDSNEMETQLDNLANDCIKAQLKQFHYSDLDSFTTIKVIGNYANLDELDHNYIQRNLDLSKIDSENTFYRIGVVSECYYPVNFKNFLKNPFKILKAILNSASSN